MQRRSTFLFSFFLACVGMWLADSAAASAGVPEDASAFASFVPLILIMAIMYFLIIRPQQKRYKAHQEMVTSVKRGDKVLTGGGIVGKIVKVDDDNDIATIEIADSVQVQVARSTIANVYGTDAPSAKPASSKASKKKTANDN